MKVRTYLVISSTGRVKALKHPPALDVFEIFVEVNLNIPDHFFDRPTARVDIDLPDDAIAGQDAIVRIHAEQVAESLGIDVESVEDGLRQAVEGSKTDV